MDPTCAPRIPDAASASVKVCRAFGMALCGLLLLAPSLLGQNPNPVPFVHQPLVPTAVVPGGPDFTLTVNGAGFVAESIVQWNGSPRPTNFVSNTQLTAAIPATDIATIGSASITVFNPAPGGGVSNAVFLSITSAQSSVAVVPYYPSSGGPTAFADFNVDGKMDMAIVDWPCRGCSPLLQIFRGNGDGTFEGLLVIGGQISSFLSNLAVTADLNGDGKPDLIMGQQDSYTTGSLAILLGNGDGTFAALPKTQLDFGLSSRSLAAVADLNQDGMLDLAMPAASQTDSGVAILLGNGNGTFGSPVVHRNIVPHTSPVVSTGDFNRDGKLDLALGSYDSGTVVIMRGDGNGGFLSPFNAYPAPSSLVSVVAGDFNGDGDLDLAVVGFNELRILIAKGDGTFGAGASYLPSRGFGIPLVGEFNGDGRVDLAVPLHNDIEGGSLVTLFYGKGDGTFEGQSFIHAPYEYASSYLIAVADFNQDGKLDIGGVPFFMQSSSPSLSPVTTVFPDQTVGIASNTREVRLTNFSGSTINIGSVQITGTNAVDFTQWNTCGASLVSPGSCSFWVAFNPNDIGPRTATLSVSDSDPTSPHTATLSGAGISPAAVPSVSSLEFDNQPLYTTSAPQTLTLSNTGVGVLTLGSITTSAEFAQTNTCASALAPGESCTISVTFTPTVAWARTGTITITDSAADSPQTVSLSGLGIPPTVTISTTSLSFGSEGIGITSPAQSVMLHNNGPGPMMVTGVSATGNFAQTNNCLGSLDALASCTINVTFTPTAAGTRTGALTIHDNAVAAPHSVELAGTGLAPWITLSTKSLTFADQNVGTTSPPQMVTVTNNGPGRLTVTSVSVAGDFAATNNCVETVEPSAGCTISVTFTPVANGERNGKLTISSNAVGNPRTVGLTGTGLAPVASLSPASLDFPNQTVGVASAPQTITFTNSGGAAMDIHGILATTLFAETNNCPATLSAGANCSIEVSFTPAAIGTTYGAVVVSHSAVGSPHTIELSGNGMDLQLAIAPGAPDSATVTAGSAATFGLVLDPKGFVGNASMACAWNGQQPVGASCTVSPNPVSLNGADPAPVTIRVTTTARAGVAPPFGDHGSPLQPTPWARHAAPLLAGLLILGAVAAASHRPDRIGMRTPAFQWAPLGAALIFVILWASCGGGGTAPLTPKPPGTPAGNYTLTVNVAAGEVTQTTVLGLTVN